MLVMNGLPEASPAVAARAVLAAMAARAGKAPYEAGVTAAVTAPAVLRKLQRSGRHGEASRVTVPPLLMIKTSGAVGFSGRRRQTTENLFAATLSLTSAPVNAWRQSPTAW